MYKLYNVKAWGSLAPHCVLEELDIPYQNIWLTPEQVRSAEYERIHPLRYIPALGLPDGRTVIESAAIVTYLTSVSAGKRLSPEVGSLDYGVFLSHLNFMSTSLYPVISMTYPQNYLAMDAAHDAFLVKKATERSHDVFGLFESHLAKEGPWLMGEAYSALDPYLFMLTLWARPSEIELHAKFPHIGRHAGEVRSRPKLKAVLEAHGVLKPGGYGS